eukprot:COSAG02_NODE_104_length_36421_cov_132.465420_2_plen_51_part_00
MSLTSLSQAGLGSLEYAKLTEKYGTGRSVFDDPLASLDLDEIVVVSADLS